MRQRSRRRGIPPALIGALGAIGVGTAAVVAFLAINGFGVSRSATRDERPLGKAVVSPDRHSETRTGRQLQANGRVRPDDAEHVEPLSPAEEERLFALARPYMLERYEEMILAAALNGGGESPFGEIRSDPRTFANLRIDCSPLIESLPVQGDVITDENGEPLRDPVGRIYRTGPKLKDRVIGREATIFFDAGISPDGYQRRVRVAAEQRGDSDWEFRGVIGYESELIEDR